MNTNDDFNMDDHNDQKSSTSISKSPSMFQPQPPQHNQTNAQLSSLNSLNIEKSNEKINVNFNLISKTFSHTDNKFDVRYCVFCNSKTHNGIAFLTDCFCFSCGDIVHANCFLKSFNTRQCLECNEFLEDSNLNNYKIDENTLMFDFLKNVNLSNSRNVPLFMTEMIKHFFLVNDQKNKSLKQEIDSTHSNIRKTARQLMNIKDKSVDNFFINSQIKNLALLYSTALSKIGSGEDVSSKKRRYTSMVQD